ncbi:hypothetical protein CVT25_015745 [Psilocybe cyanescens]|uniref:Uncharacterized protein n=1 Tax=Psilocybe cyanescens TaxID=93625 RepID=A0A409WRS5_PSICY|nr:hypothetical protein CVT25_015745 [Psilocybe cyanescens]
MTEYDFSPEAFEAHLRKQQQIARWVDKTNHSPTLRNPFTPATPAVRALKLQGGYDSEDDRDSSDHRRHRRHESKDSRDRRRDKDKERERDRGREREREREHYQSDSPARPHTKRHRSTSHSQPATRPEPSRNYTVPPPLPLNTSPISAYPPNSYPQNPYAPRIASPRDSRHSSRSSSTQVPSPTSYFPQQQPPYSAPAAYKAMPTPIRSQTVPHYYSPDAKYSSAPYYQNGPYVYPAGSPVKPVDYDVRTFSSFIRSHLFTIYQNVPQYPFSAYQIKQPPLLKRIFLGITGGKKQQQRKVVSRKRSSSF